MLTSWFSCVWCFLVFCHFSIWCPGSGVVLDYIDSWYMQNFLTTPTNHYVASYILVCSPTNHNGDILMLVISTTNHYLAIYILEGFKPNIFVSWFTSEYKARLAPLNMFKPSSIFTDRSKAGAFLWICFTFVFIYCLVCSLQNCGHLLRKRWPIGALVCDVFLRFYPFPIWCLGSGVVLGCIDFWSLLSFLLSPTHYYGAI